MRGEEKPDNAIYTAERAGMKKHRKAKAVSTVGNRMEMRAGGMQEASYDNRVDCHYAMPVYNPMLQLLLGVGGGHVGSAYKSMSWSTSSRERAKLGRLDSEPPLLLREWPPETGQKDKERGARRTQANKGRRAEERESQQANTAVEEGERGRERKREEGEREGRIYPFTSTGFKTFLKEQFTQKLSAHSHAAAKSGEVI